MITSYSNNETVDTAVFESLSMTLAAVVCGQFEHAGVQARLGKVQSGFAVFVPARHASECRDLLTGQPRQGEILY